MKYGYARVSSDGQDTALQLDALSRADVQTVVWEKRSARRCRPELTALVERLGAGDELVVWKVDRLARSVRDLVGLLDAVHAKGAMFRSLTEPFDTRTAAGRMVVQMLGVVAEFEWSMIRERSMAGQQAARERGATCGRPRAMTVADEARCYRERCRGASMTELARRYGVSVSCIKRVIYRVERPTASCVARLHG